MDNTQKRKNEIYLVFGDSGSRLLNKVLKKGFAHVFAIRKHERGWVILDPCDKYFKSNVVQPDFNLPQFYIKKGYHVVRVRILDRYSDTNKFIPKFIPVLTCVTFCKYVLGFNFLCITPYGLYKKLIKWHTPMYKRLVGIMLPYMAYEVSKNERK